MKFLWAKILPIFLLLFVSTIVAASQDRQSYSALRSSLTSEEEFRSQLESLKIKIPSVTRTSAICADLGSCEEVTYYDDFYKLHYILGNTGINRLKGFSDWDDTAARRQLELQAILYDGGLAEDLRNCKHFVTWPGRPVCTLKHHQDYLDAFKNNNDLNPISLESLAEKNIKESFSRLMSGKIEASEFSQSVLNSPKAFYLLPSLLAQARGTENSQVDLVLQDVIGKALLLTLDAMVPVADSRNDTYPFVDNLVPQDSLLPVDLLYKKLKALGQWPAIVDLTSVARGSLGGIYEEKIGSGAPNSLRWKVKGFYDEGRNQIDIDLGSDFYENVYVYFHELWHVAWNHSAENHHQILAIQELLKAPDGEANQKTLRTSLLKMISTNEFLAIDQQIRLFHALGFQTEEWDSAAVSSALAWHDSYIGREAYELLLPEKARGADMLTRHPTLSYFMLVPQGVDAFWEAGRELKYDFKMKKIQRELDQAYWTGRMQKHSMLFEDRYFGEDLGLAGKIQVINPVQLLSSIENPYIPALSCSDIARVRTALGRAWKFGFPFDHTVSDPQNCAGEDSGPDHPGTEGTHGGVDAFPSLDGEGL